MSDLEYQAATLAARDAGLWLAAAQVFVGVLQCAVVAWGIRAMVGANDERARAADEDRREAREARREAREAREAAEAAAVRRDEAAEAAGVRRDEADRRRHAEAMAAIGAQNRRLDTQSAALAEAVTALKVVVERAAPAPAQ